MTTEIYDFEEVHKYFSQFQMEQVGDNQYRLYKDKESRMESVFILFTKPESHIVIYGDLAPYMMYGIVSCTGYGKGWFSNTLSKGYLAEKFPLKAEWIPELKDNLLKNLQNCLEDYAEDDEELKSSQKYLNDFFEEHDFDQESPELLYKMEGDPIIGKVFDWEWYSEMYGYNPRDYRLLVGIQKRFSELIKELENGDNNDSNQYLGYRLLKV